MITRLHIENFKSWRDTGELRFAPLTGFFGANSSGKTAILQFLLMLKQTVDSPDPNEVLNFGDERDPVMLGTFPDVVFGHETKRSLRWSFECRQIASWLKLTNYSFEAEIREGEAGALKLQGFRYLIGGSSYGLKKQEQEGEEGYELLYDDKRVGLSTLPEDQRLPSKIYGFATFYPAIRSLIDLPPTVAGIRLSHLELYFEETFDRVLYLGPLREYPRREYTWSGGRPTGVGRSGERAVDALLAARLNGATRSAEEHVARWLQKLGLIHEFRIAEIAPESRLYRVLVRRSKASPEVLLTEVGFGVSQILPVLVLCYYAPEGSTLILEQPEIHLHPSVQAGLADVLIDAIQKRDIQILLESHSEYLLNRLQRRIAEDNGFTHDDVALYFCSIEDGESRATPLEVDSFGNITNWPRDFFGDEMGDLAARTRAEMERRKAKAG